MKRKIIEYKEIIKKNAKKENLDLKLKKLKYLLGIRITW